MTSTSGPIVTPTPEKEVDYTKMLEEYQPKNWSDLPDNPYFETADGFFEFDSAPDATKGSDIEFVPTNCRQRGSYKLKTKNAYYKVLYI